MLDDKGLSKILHSSWQLMSIEYQARSWLSLVISQGPGWVIDMGPNASCDLKAWVIVPPFFLFNHSYGCSPCAHDFARINKVMDPLWVKCNVSLCQLLTPKEKTQD